MAILLALEVFFLVTKRLQKGYKVTKKVTKPVTEPHTIVIYYNFIINL